VLDVDILHKTLSVYCPPSSCLVLCGTGSLSRTQGYAEITLQPLSSSLSQIVLHARQLRMFFTLRHVMTRFTSEVLKVTVNGLPAEHVQWNYLETVVPLEDPANANRDLESFAK
jgi:hypothetical protein